MRTELISIPTATHPLDGAYYTPDGPSKGAVMYCHGNQMSFYVCAARFLAHHITALGYEYLAFNRRGHDSVSTYDSRERRRRLSDRRRRRPRQRLGCEILS
jgi:alpha-beta hydrolase superfamily lysophospholipase